MRRFRMRAVALAAAVLLGMSPTAPANADPTAPVVCPAGKSLQGDYIFLIITPQGDKYILVISRDGGIKIYDCPPYDSAA